MYYLIFYMALVLSVIWAKTNAYSREIASLKVMIFFEIIIFVYITIGHGRWIRKSRRKLDTGEAIVQRLEKDLSIAMDHRSVAAIDIHLINIYAMNTLLNDNVQTFVCLLLVLLAPVYIYKGINIITYRNEIKRLLKQLNDIEWWEKKICVVEYRWKFFPLYSRFFIHRFFKKNPAYREIILREDYLFVPDFIARGLKSLGKSKDIEFTEYSSVYYDELYVDKKDMEKCRVNYISSLDGSQVICDKVKKNLLPLVQVNVGDAGKAFVKRVVNRLAINIHFPVETFYELIKLSEYMTHFQSLADYEKCGASYFERSKEMSFGAFAENVIENEQSGYYNSETFRESYKKLYVMMHDKNIKIPKRNIAHETRMLLVNVRNHFIGHGTMTYSVSEEFVLAMIDVIAPLVDDFMQGNVEIKEPLIKGTIEKVNRDGLLICVYDNGCGLYQNYENGSVHEIGGKYRMKLNYE